MGGGDERRRRLGGERRSLVDHEQQPSLRDRLKRIPATLSWEAVRGLAGFAAGWLWKLALPALIGVVALLTSLLEKRRASVILLMTLGALAITVFLMNEGAVWVARIREKRRRVLSWAESMRFTDGHADRVHMCGITGRFELASQPPFIDFVVTVFNGSIWPLQIATAIRGRVGIPNGELTQPPELKSLERPTGSNRSSWSVAPEDDEITIGHADELAIHFRQYLQPAEVAFLQNSRGEVIKFSFQNVDIPMWFIIRPDEERDEERMGPRLRLRLNVVPLTVPA